MMDEMILSRGVFLSLQRDHFMKLLPKLKLGQHAVLLKYWEDERYAEAEQSKDLLTNNSSEERLSRGSSNSGSVRSRSPNCSHSTSSDEHTTPDHGGKNLLSSKKDIKELAQLYKANAISRFGKGAQANKVCKLVTEDGTTIKVLLGGMVYDNTKNKVVRRKFLPEPNPTKVEMDKKSTICNVYEKSIDLYYKQFSTISVNDVMLADSAGNIIEISNPTKWTLGDYYNRNPFLPSRHKLYTVVDLSKNKEYQDGKHEDDNEVVIEEMHGKMVYTEPVMQQCTVCNRDYRTYIPDTICRLGLMIGYYFDGVCQEWNDGLLWFLELIFQCIWLSGMLSPFSLLVTILHLKASSLFLYV